MFHRGLYLVTFLAAVGIAACEDNDNHGVGDACAKDADCAAGLECEIEHGEGYCKEHGGDDDSHCDDDSNGDDSNSGGSN